MGPNKLAPTDFIDEFKRVLSQPAIFLFLPVITIGKWHEAFDSEFDTFQFMVWHKTNPFPIYENRPFK